MVNTYGTAYFPDKDAGSLEGFIEERTGVDPTAPKPYKDHITLLCGVDLGKRFDRSACSVVEQQYTGGGLGHYYVRNLQRFRLGTSYSSVAKALKNMDTQLRLYAAKQGKTPFITWLIEANGVGEGVIEIIERELPNAQLYKVYVTGGINASVDYNEIKLPKSQMLSRLVALYDAGLIHMSKKSRQINAMIDELQSFNINVSESNGHETYGAKIGKHDDMVISLALACWYGQSQQPYQPRMVW
jgi:hypothetical protein